MANNTLKLHRTHYSISETAKILGCDEQDVIYIADEKDIPLSLRMCGRWSFSKHKVRDVDSFIQNINSLKKDKDGFSYISEFSLIKINEVKKDKKLVLASTKAISKCHQKLKVISFFMRGSSRSTHHCYLLLVPPILKWSNIFKLTGKMMMGLDMREMRTWSGKM